MLRRLAGLRQIDRRVISLLVLIMLALPLIIRVDLTIKPQPPCRKLKAAIDRVPKDQLIIVATDWDASTRGECRPLTAAFMDYLMREGRPFAIMSLFTQGGEQGELVAKDIARKHGKKYGVDWINFGYRPNYVTTLIAMMNDLPATVKKDIRDVDVTTYPMMKGVKSLKDVGFLYQVTGSGILDLYIQFCAGVPLGHGCTAVIGPQQYPYLQAGQIKGLLVGLGGAAQFEVLSGFQDETGRTGGQGLRGMGSQSLGHLLVMLLIVLGNLSVWAEKKLNAAPPAAPPGPDAPSQEGAEA